MKKLFIWLFIGLSLFPLSVHAEEMTDTTLAANSKSAILIENTTGKVLFEKNVDERVAIASLTKMMSQIIILEQIEAGKLTWDYLIQIRGYGLVDAVHTLVGGEIQQAPAYRSATEKAHVQKEPEKKPFSLPWVRRCATSAVSYLQRRGISSDVIGRCFRKGLFYEARYHGEPVCVFVGKDEAGKAKFACMRSITGNLRKDVYGSDKEYSFCYPPRNPGSRHVAVFEAPIDALSHATLQELKGWKWDGYRLSLGGTSHVALTAFLKRHPEIRRVSLYMDNDLGGLKNARRIKAMLHEDQRFKHIRVGINPPRIGKDYNEMLLHVTKKMKDHQQQCRQKQAAISI